MKKCSTCKELKEAGEFYRCISKYDGLQAHCKSCQYIKSLSDQHKKGVRKSKLKILYGLTVEQFKQILNKQNGICKLCPEENNLQVDHDHITGKVRGLLCYRCNRGLGFFQDNQNTLEKAILYLKDS